MGFCDAKEELLHPDKGNLFLLFLLVLAVFVFELLALDVLASILDRIWTKAYLTSFELFLEFDPVMIHHPANVKELF